MAMPADDQPRSGWLSDLRYVARHPGPTLALGARRVAMEMAHVRPYYRVRHNVMIVAVLLPLYALAAVGIAATWRHPLTHLLLGVVAAHLLLVAVCLADYDGRFLLHVMGPLAALAAAGVGRLTGGAAGAGGRGDRAFAARRVCPSAPRARVTPWDQEMSRARGAAARSGEPETGSQGCHPPGRR
jgi:hypothetical protein